MRLIALTTLTMIAFAANSLLNRAGLAGEYIGPAGFALIRVVAGAVMLWGLLWAKARQAPPRPSPDWAAVAGLVAYLVGFSFAYVALDAGLGALVLFAGVQITMFVGAILGGDRFPARRWGGMAISLGGLAYLVWPGQAQSFDPWALGLMALAALGWGVYSLIGRRASAPLAATAWNFVYAVPLVALASFPFVMGEGMTASGVLLAITSGAVTSGLGYALWYRVLPALGASTGALAQLSVPVIAMLAGVILLGEGLTLRAVLASALVLGGIAFGLLPRR
ncbi:DMT family transporter [Aliiroseovarius sp. Z3]|uniref:DMT family transporter n=1 Tax=Aliiroseovarius sp. Z3 TaxID=2811402 RepID=UPI0023B23141|nr:DMT family transporter [Aliiroseovarius sp. Z3]